MGNCYAFFGGGAVGADGGAVLLAVGARCDGACCFVAGIVLAAEWVWEGEGVMGVVGEDLCLGGGEDAEDGKEGYRE